jgi:hypothetical protein
MPIKSSRQGSPRWVSTLGCGSGNPFDIVPVHGKLTYDDGSLIPAESILVTFNPIGVERREKLVAPGGQTYLNVSDGTYVRRRHESAQGRWTRRGATSSGGRFIRQGTNWAASSESCRAG